MAFRQPTIGDKRRKESRQDVADARRDREDPRQLPLEISDEEHAAEDPERLDADQPVLRDAADDGAEREDAVGNLLLADRSLRSS